VVVVSGDARSSAVFGDRCLCRGQLDNGFAGGVGRDQRSDREVVDGARIAARGEMDGVDSFVGEERIGPAGIFQLLPDAQVELMPAGGRGQAFESNRLALSPIE